MGNAVEPIRDIDAIHKIEELLGTRDGLIWAIGTQIGLRVSDVIKLKTDIVGKNEYLVREKKTGKYKKFPINEELKDKIENYYINHRCNLKAHSKIHENSLFLTRKHTQITSTTFYRNLVKVAQSLGISSNIGTHTMRKTFGYHHYKQFNDVALLQKIFNHSQPVVTLRYIGIEQDEIDKSYKKFKYKEEREEETPDLEKTLKFVLQDYFVNNESLVKTLEYGYNQQKKQIQEISERQKRIEDKLDKIFLTMLKW